jgi:hypothetical protein
VHRTEIAKKNCERKKKPNIRSDRNDSQLFFASQKEGGTNNNLVIYHSGQILVLVLVLVLVQIQVKRASTGTNTITSTCTAIAREYTAGD